MALNVNEHFVNCTECLVALASSRRLLRTAREPSERVMVEILNEYT